MKKKAFLFLDDERIILETLTHTLKNAFGSSFLFETTTNPLQAIEIIKDLEISEIGVVLIISDLKMPEMNGIDFVRKVYSYWPDIKCLIVSAHSSNEEIETIKLEKNVIGYFQKPWSSMELISYIRQKILND